MKRAVFGTMALVVALGIGAAAQGQRQIVRENWWQKERTFQLAQILERARVSYNDALLKVEIGTMAPIDVKSTQDAVAQMEAMVKADAGRTTTPQGTAATRIRLAELLNALDAAEVRFNVGLISTKEMNDAYLAIVRLLVN